MLVRYWQPWREMETLRNQLDHAFGELTQTIESPTWAPAVEVKDTGDHVVLRAQLPGVEAKDIDVQVMKDSVLITAEHKKEQETEQNGYLKTEFRYGKFHRVVGLPVAVQNDKVQAEYKDGILNLTLPKVTEARNKVVKINLAEHVEQPAVQAADQTSDQPATLG
jgi:HSP20 family protein